MAKLIEYPNASFKACLTMAEAIDSLGGSCSIEMCAQKMGNKISGAFNSVIGAAQKFKLITQKSGQLNISDLYREIKLAYTEQERLKHLIIAFLSPPVFTRLFERFKGRELPVEMLDKMLIKEYSVDGNAASRIKKYFVDGLKSVNLMNDQNKLLELAIDVEIETDAGTSGSSQVSIIEESSNQSVQEQNSVISISDLDEYVFHIMGPGINSRIAIREEEDFMILEAMIKKIKKRFDIKS